jgi:hypothetical protein
VEFGAEINYITTPPFSVVVPDIEPLIHLKGSGFFLPEGGQIPMIGPVYFLGMVAQLSEVFHQVYLPSFPTGKDIVFHTFLSALCFMEAMTSVRLK